MTAGTVHASVALVGERGVLVRGDSGSGKTSIVLALIDADPAGNALVADDRAVLAAANGRLLASAPAELAGLIEIRGQGIVRAPHASPVVIDLVVDLMPAADCPRMPEADYSRTTIAGIALPRLALPIDCRDGALRIRHALAMAAAENAK